MSTPAGGGGSRRPSATKPGGKPTTGAAKATASNSTTTGKSTTAGKSTSGAKTGAGKAAAARPSAGGRPANGGKGGGRRPVAPMRVSQGRNWVSIGLVGGVVLIALGIVGFAGWQVYDHGRSWQDRAKGISGLVNYKLKDKSLEKGGQHAWGPLTYPQSPPVGGKHNYNWQNCMGDVYDQPIASEHAVHSMEHGAVWVTYNPDTLDKAGVDQLAKKVRGKEYLLMSPYKGLDSTVSLQAWGYQLKVGSAGDSRIDDFIKDLRKNAGVEDGAVCSGGITETGTTPHDLGKDNPQQQQQQPQQPVPTG